MPGLKDKRVSRSCSKSSGKWNNKHRLTQDQSWPAGGDDLLCLKDSGKSSQRRHTLAELAGARGWGFVEPVTEEGHPGLRKTPIEKKGALEYKM